METDFTPIASAVGGVLIGCSAVMLMALHGRIAGATGILSGILPPYSADSLWRLAFLAGAILTPFVFVASGGTVPFGVPVSAAALVVGGFIVGVGVTFGGGCTSGHGVCGMARLSPRSFIATITFMITCGITVFVIRQMLGGI